MFDWRCVMIVNGIKIFLFASVCLLIFGCGRSIESSDTVSTNSQTTFNSINLDVIGAEALIQASENSSSEAESTSSNLYKVIGNDISLVASNVSINAITKISTGYIMELKVDYLNTMINGVEFNTNYGNNIICFYISRANNNVVNLTNYGLDLNYYVGENQNNDLLFNKGVLRYESFEYEKLTDLFFGKSSNNFVIGNGQIIDSRTLIRKNTDYASVLSLSNNQYISYDSIQSSSPYFVQVEENGFAEKNVTLNPTIGFSNWDAYSPLSYSLFQLYQSSNGTFAASDYILNRYTLSSDETTLTIESIELQNTDEDTQQISLNGTSIIVRKTRSLFHYTTTPSLALVNTIETDKDIQSFALTNNTVYYMVEDQHGAVEFFTYNMVSYAKNKFEMDSNVTPVWVY